MSNPTAAILIIGNEILSGRTQDVNVQFIAKRLAELGIKIAGGAGDPGCGRADHRRGERAARRL